MDNIVFACIAPHGGELIPLLSGPASAKAQASRAALTELGRRLAAAQPETIVIIEPHGLMVHGAISLLDSTRVHGAVDSATAPDDLAHSLSMTFAVDRSSTRPSPQQDALQGCRSPVRATSSIPCLWRSTGPP